MMSKRRTQAHSHMIGELFTFLLFAMFLILSLLIVVIGADGYRGVVDASETVGEMRTSLGYVAGKLRSDAANNGARLVPFGEDGNALILTEMYEGTRYDTAIYYQDGALYEAYINADELALEDAFGDRLVEVAGFDMALEGDSLLALTATASSGQSQTMHVALRMEQGGQN